RDGLVKMLKGRIRLYENDMDRPADTKANSEIRKAEEAARAAQDQAIQKTLKVIAQMRKEGRTAEAARLADDLARRYPNNPAPQARGPTTARPTPVAGKNDTRRGGSSRLNDALVTVEKSKLPPAGDLEFPKDWNTRIKTRKGLNEPPLTKKEQEIVKSLGKP